jgi:mono/diheme cytochrome c family protein
MRVPSRYTIPALPAVLAIVLPAVTAEAADPPADVAGENVFAVRVLPLLNARCFACHGGDPARVKGGLDLRTRATLLRGGTSGQPAVVAGQPERSPLYLAVRRTSPDWKAMPPKEDDRLADADVRAVRDWIAAGAPWPSDARIRELARADREGVAVKTSGGLTPDWTDRKYRPEDLWAYRPVVKGRVPASEHANLIDAFLAAGLDEVRLPPAGPADRRTLVRRVTFDLTGLPPTPEEAEAFVNDPAPEDAAWVKLIDRLLASPQYGERMAQHWLDVTRYADSSGFANDYERGSAWRYRDYVVRSFNADKPYDRFVREQLAGDEIAPDDPELLVAVGFLRMGPWELTGMEVPKVARQRFLDDVTDTVGQVFLAQPLQCARCHDHKFDPIPTRDYYAVQAVFATTQPAERSAAFLDSENRTGFEAELKYQDARRAWLNQELDRVKPILADARARWLAENPQRKGEKPPFDKLVSAADLGRERIARKGLERLAWAADRCQPFALSVYAGRTPERKTVTAPFRVPADRLTAGELERTCVLAGGDPFSPKDGVVPGVLSAANGGSSGEVPATIEGRRKAFADWVAAPKNPLTARVMVNRVWAWHFGTPLAGTPNNFGATGKRPTHPELLDWLAATFVEKGWSVKALHRLILTSAAYRRSSRHPDPKVLAAKDPLGVRYAAFRPRRLSAEELRDAMLSASGELNRQVGGIPCRPELSAEVALRPRQVMGTFAEAWQPNARPEQRHRRSLYVLRLRGLRDPFFEAFDQPGPDAPCELRTASTVAPQAFALFNGEASSDRALALAARAVKETRSREEAVALVFRRALGRGPTAPESKACLAHWEAMTARHAQLTFEKPTYPRSVVREALEENTGEKFRFTEPLEVSAHFVPDLKPADCPLPTRGLAEVCLVLFNTNEFAYIE